MDDVPTTSNGLVLQAVYRNGPLSRARLAAATGLSKASISNQTRSLLTAGLLRETQAARSGREQGRPHVLLDVNPDHGWFAGVRIDEDSMRLAVTDLKGSGGASAVVPIDHQPDELALLIEERLGDLVRRAKIPRARLLGLGIAVSGLVDHRTGICHHSANLGWREVPIGELTQRATGLPTRVENDTNAVAIAQQMFGRARDYSDVIVVTLGRGIGAAEFLDGRLYRGPDGGAGELGHCTVDPDGDTCRCGKRGCLDTVAAEWAILNAARRAGLETHDLVELEALAATGNAPAMTILKRAGGALGLAVSHLINLQSPQLVLVSGIGAELGAIMLSATRQALENSILPRRLASTTIEFNNFDEDLWARGAASIAAHDFLVHYGAND